jgi:signal transduction histidine kinase
MAYRLAVRTRTAWQAMAQHPWGFLSSAWPWRALLYLLTGVLLGAVTAAVLAAAVTAGVFALAIGVGAVLLLAIAVSGVAVARLERWRLRLVDTDRTADPHRAPDGPGVRAWLRTRLREPATWRELGFTYVSVTALCWLDLVVLGFAFGAPAVCIAAPFDDPVTWPFAVLGGVLLVAAPYTVTAWAGARAALTRTMLAPRDAELGEQLVEVHASRARLVGAFEAERARIERDLHDGVQQRLVSLSMTLGMLRLDVPDPSPVHEQLGLAQDQVGAVLTELRDLVRGLNPQVLDDHGLVVAIEENAGRLPIPVTVDVHLAGRLPRAVERTAYFLVTEAMANVAKHSRATAAGVVGRRHADLFVLEITDDGVGGADPADGTGLTGLADRLAVLGGRMRLSSPPGGPTLLHAEIPCP